MKAFILAAGLGTRLRPFTNHIPKPLMPLPGGDTVLGRLLGQLSRQGFTEFVINTHYLADHIADYVGDGSTWGMKAHISFERTLLGTAGGILQCQPLLTEPFLVLSGDLVTDIDFAGLMRYREEHDAKLVICTRKSEETERFGVVKSEDGIVVRFQEKPRKGLECSNEINTGIYAMTPDILCQGDISQDLVPTLDRVHSRLTGRRWSDIGTIEEYFKTYLAL